MKIYTKTGDLGETSLLGGQRVRKDDPRIEVYGTLDELSSTIGVGRASGLGPLLDAVLYEVQLDLFDLGALFASSGSSEEFPGVREGRITFLESSIDSMERELEPLRNFILPGGAAGAAHLHVARTICRRAERIAVRLETSGDAIQRAIRYLNRLSDYLFVAARLANHQSGVPDVPWITGK
ncbi:MAG TPA: cob(I)yrinic acid a,c-diamide adenosyltransferase [Thermoanaerobaculia bacterium]|nr:cob(I)yrinic acid a,c-diamide adenosyltransferase [Thermoanaerobaculia bacterium]